MSGPIRCARSVRAPWPGLVQNFIERSRSCATSRSIQYTDKTACQPQSETYHMGASRCCRISKHLKSNFGHSGPVGGRRKLPPHIPKLIVLADDSSMESASKAAPAFLRFPLQVRCSIPRSAGGGRLLRISHVPQGVPPISNEPLVLHQLGAPGESGSLPGTSFRAEPWFQSSLGAERQARRTGSIPI